MRRPGTGRRLVLLRWSGGRPEPVSRGMLSQTSRQWECRGQLRGMSLKDVLLHISIGLASNAADNMIYVIELYLMHVATCSEIQSIQAASHITDFHSK